MTKRTCEREGCDKPYRARGLCVTHYNDLKFPDRHAPKAAECVVCGAAVMKAASNSKSRRPVCSYACRTELQWGASRARKALILAPSGACSIERTRPESAPTRRQTRIFVSGECTDCGNYFTRVMPLGGSLPYTCSSDCASRITRRRWRELHGRFAVSSKVRRAIYNRDDWTCQICHEPTSREYSPNDEWSPTLDHIIPRSRGGSDDESNLRTAHAWCNSVRGDETYYTDDDLRVVAA